ARANAWGGTTGTPQDSKCSGARVVRRISCADSEASQHFSSSQGSDVQRAALGIPGQPALLQRKVQQRRPQRPAQVGAPLAPVEAGKGKPAPALAGCLEVDAQG